MCIAAISLNGGFTEQELGWFFEANTHGGGYAFVDQKGELCKIPHILTKEAYVKAGMALKDVKNLVTHCRIATCGERSLLNAHPFVNERKTVAMVHNGQFTAGGEGAKSDTNVFFEMTNGLLEREDLLDEKAVKELGHLIGSYNKLILLYKTNNFKIINEKEGLWSTDGTKWYSNRYWARGTTP